MSCSAIYDPTRHQLWAFALNDDGVVQSLFSRTPDSAQFLGPLPPSTAVGTPTSTPQPAVDAVGNLHLFARGRVGDKDNQLLHCYSPPAGASGTPVFTSWARLATDGNGPGDLACDPAAVLSGSQVVEVLVPGSQNDGNLHSMLGITGSPDLFRPWTSISGSIAASRLGVAAGAMFSGSNRVVCAANKSNEVWFLIGGQDGNWRGDVRACHVDPGYSPAAFTIPLEGKTGWGLFTVADAASGGLYGAATVDVNSATFAFQQQACPFDSGSQISACYVDGFYCVVGKGKFNGTAGAFTVMASIGKGIGPNFNYEDRELTSVLCASDPVIVPSGTAGKAWIFFRGYPSSVRPPLPVAGLQAYQLIC